MIKKYKTMKTIKINVNKIDIMDQLRFVDTFYRSFQKN